MGVNLISFRYDMPLAEIIFDITTYIYEMGKDSFMSFPWSLLITSLHSEQKLIKKREVILCFIQLHTPDSDAFEIN